MVYVREAHPVDGRVSGQNEAANIAVRDPRTKEEREYVAGKACSILKLSMPCLVDEMDDRVNRAYAAWPERLYVVDLNGNLAVAGQRGPFGFSPSLDAAESWLSRNLKP